MSIYFDFKTISELTGDNNNFYRQQKEFNLDELAQYDGKNGKAAYVAIEGIVYDVSNEPVWSQENHMGITAGEDLTEQFNSCYGMDQILKNAPKIGVLAGDSDMNFGFSRQVKQNTSKFKPDDWIRYIDPLVSYAMRDSNQQGAAARRLYQKYIILGVLVGLGKTPQESINQLQQWQTTGASQILKSTVTGATTGTTGITGGQTTGTGTTGGMETVGGIGGTTGATGGLGGQTTGTGITGEMGTIGGSGGTTGTTGGFGGTTSGIGSIGGFGTGTGTPGTTGQSSGTGTSGGYGTGRNTEETTDNLVRRDRLYFD